MINGYVQGFDLSPYWQKDFDIPAAQAAKAAGHEIAIVEGSSNGGPLDFQTPAGVCKAAGLDLATYLLLNWERGDWPGGVQVQNTVNAVGPTFMKELLFFALDLETYDGWQESEPAYRAPRVTEAIAAIRATGIPLIIYTNRRQYSTLFGAMAPGWLDIGIWYAHPPDPNLTTDLWAALPWSPSKIVGKQYGSAVYGNFTVDMDIFDGNFIAYCRAERDKRLNPPPPPDPCADLKAQLTLAQSQLKTIQSYLQRIADLAAQIAQIAGGSSDAK